MSDLLCKLNSYISLALLLISDWLELTVAADRLLALKRAHFYKHNCNQRAGLLICGPIILLVLVFAFPKFWGSSLEPQGCLSGNDLYDKMLFFSGVPVVLMVSGATVVMMVELRKKREVGTKVQTNLERSVSNIALPLFCTVTSRIYLHTSWGGGGGGVKIKVKNVLRGWV